APGSTKWLLSNHGSGTLIIDVEVTGSVVKLFCGEFYGVTVLRNNRTGERINGCRVHSVQNFLKFLSLIHVDTEHRPKQLFAHCYITWIADKQNGRLNKVPFTFVVLAACN